MACHVNLRIENGELMVDDRVHNPFVLVVSTGEIGKIVERIGENSWSIEFSDSPTEKFRKTLASSDFKKYIPEVNGLVWFPELIGYDSNGEGLLSYVRGSWLLERENGQWGVTIRRSGTRADENLLISPDQLLIHRSGSHFNPVKALSERLAMSSKYFVTRHNLIEELYKQLQVARGFRSILSAKIRPFRHQVNAMVRVLSEPVPRFVLADEVGLGKTIEAGLIIRQILLDDPQKYIRVVVPSYLVGQWESELIEKFGLIDHLNLGNISIETFFSGDSFSDCDMLVVDEAHKITGSPFDRFYSSIKRTLKPNSGLLLLTATPMRGNLGDYLKLLHLVDPESYPIEEESQFKRRLELREEGSRLIDYIKVAGIPKESLLECFRKIQDLFPLDSYGTSLVEDIEVKIRNSEDAVANLNLLSNYLRERYRISRRVIRNRRTEVIDEGFLVTGREITDGSIVEIREDLRPLIDAFVSQFLHESAQIRTLGIESESELLSLVEFVLESALSAPEVFHSALKDHRFTSFIDLYSDRLRELIDEFDLDFDRLGNSTRWSKTFEICQKHVTYPRSGGVVVFVGNSDVAQRIAYELSAKHGQHHIALHVASMSTEDQDSAVEHFVHEDGCRILIMDQSGDEGRNLQSASETVHFSVPLSANRLEQRLGRTDRFCEAQDHRATSTVFLEPQSALVSGQFRYLNDGLKIFSQSVATAQQMLSIEFQNLLSALLSNGLDAFTMNLNDVSVRLTEEIDNIAYVDQIESVSNLQEFTRDNFIDLVELDEFSEIENAAMGLYVFDRERIPPTADLGLLTAPSKHQRQDLTQTMRLSLGDQWRPAEMRNLRLQQKKEISRIVSRDVEYAFSRPVARTLPGVALYRVGDPLVDWTLNWIENDELGKTWAVWRHDPRKPDLQVLSGAIRVGAKPLVWNGISNWARIALSRRLEMALPSRMMNLIDVLSDVRNKDGGNVASSVLDHDDPEVFARIPKVSLTEQNITGSDWLKVHQLLPGYSLKILNSSKRMVEFANNKVKSAKDYKVRVNQEVAVHEHISSKIRNGLVVESVNLESSHSPLEEERMIHQQVLAALENPPSEVFSVGLIVMSRKPL